MAVQEYDVPRPDGSFEERYWSPLNAPVFDAQGELVYIIHRVEDVTDLVRLQQRYAEQARRMAALRTRTGEMAVEIYRRAQQEARGGEALFWVRDTGSGVPAENLPHLFDRFWQASRTDKRGAGLGLAIVKGIIDAHGGRVWAESRVGEGTTFYFTLPVADAAAAPRGDASSAA